MRRTQQNHMHHMETAASEMQAIQVCLMPSDSMLSRITMTKGFHMVPIVHPRTEILISGMACLGRVRHASMSYQR